MDIYINKIAEVLNTSVIRIDTSKELYDSLSKPRLQKTAKLYLVRDDKEYLSEEKLWDKLERAASKSGDTVIYVYSNIDKRCKFWKQHSDMVIEFNTLSSDVLIKYINAELPKLTQQYALRLSEICEYNYARILLETDKIKHYMNAVKTVRDENEAFMELLSQNAFFVPVGDITFKLTDAILTRNFSEVQTLLAQSKSIAEPEIRLLSILYNGFKQVLLVQGIGKDRSNITERTGLTPYQVKLATDKLGYYTIEELVSILQLTRAVEVGVKRGTVDIDICIDYLLLYILP